MQLTYGFEITNLAPTTDESKKEPSRSIFVFSGYKQKMGYNALDFLNLVPVGKAEAVTTSECRWLFGDLILYPDGENPNPVSLFESIRGEIKHWVGLPQEWLYDLLTAWVMATYVFPIFPSFPQLEFFGLHGSGKTQALKVLAGLAFNAYYFDSITPSAFADISNLRATIFYDEAEQFKDNSRDPKIEENRTILRARYDGGIRLKMEKAKGGGWKFVKQNQAGPTAVGTIEGMTAKEESRAFPICMSTHEDYKNVEKVDEKSPRFAPLRAKLYRWGLANWQRVRSSYKQLTNDQTLQVKFRDRELAIPLISTFFSVFEDCNPEVLKSLKYISNESEIDDYIGIYTSFTSNIAKFLQNRSTDIAEDQPEGQLLKVLTSLSFMSSGTSDTSGLQDCEKQLTVTDILHLLNDGGYGDSWEVYQKWDREAELNTTEFPHRSKIKVGVCMKRLGFSEGAGNRKHVERGQVYVIDETEIIRLKELARARGVKIIGDG